MKNVKENQLRKCILKGYDEFKRDVAEALEHDVEITCDYDGLYFECNGDALCPEEILCGMSKYYGVQVTSIHIDDYEPLGVWIVYK